MAVPYFTMPGLLEESERLKGHPDKAEAEARGEVALPALGDVETDEREDTDGPRRRSRAVGTSG